MNQQSIFLVDIPSNKKARIISIQGGYRLQRKLRVMGIREEREIKIVTRQPLRGPLTVEVHGNQITLGRGMAQKILVEVIQ